MIFILIFFAFIYNLFNPKNYTYKYKVDKYDVMENYNKKEKVYSFSIKKKKTVYKYAFKHKYSTKRGLVKKIKTSKNCIDVTHDMLDKISICQKGKKYTTKYYDTKIPLKKKKEYKKIKIYDLKDHKYYIWNYTSFIIVDDDKNKKMSLFNDDLYELGIIYKLDNHLIIADYNSKYYFSDFFLINMKNDKKEKVKINRKLHMTSYILGDYKKNLYLYDPEVEKEYRFNPFEEEIEDNSYEILINNNWQKTTVNKLNKKNQTFINDENFGYYIKDGKLYYKMLDSSILITNLRVSHIVQKEDKDCFFISDDTLYYVNFDDGITAVMKYSEWKFNNKNIYIY